MKKIYSILFVLILLLATLLSCGDATESTKQNEVDPSEGKFLMGASEGSSSAVGFQAAAAFGIDTASIQVEEQSLSGEMKQPFGSDETTYTYAYTSYQKQSSLSEKYGEFYSSYDRYTSGKGSIEYLHGTDILAFYHRTGLTMIEKTGENGEAELSEEEAVRIAEEFLTKLLPASVWETYTYRDTDEDAVGRSAVTYVRYVEGYETDETVAVWIHPTGIISAYNGYNVQKYDTLLDRITKEKLDAAYAELKAKVEELNLTNLTCYEPALTTNTSGDLYLELFIRYDSIPQGEMLNCVYIRVD